MVIVTMDTETGEKLEGKFYSNEQLEAYENKKHKQTVKNRSERPFTFIEMDTVERELSGMCLKDLGYLLVMQTYINYNNMLKYTPDDVKPMTRAELGKVLNITDKPLQALIQRFKDQGILIQEKEKVNGKVKKKMYISDNYCFRKSKNNQSRSTTKTVKLFMDDLQQVYNQTNIKPADVGILYKIIPHLHYSTNFLVRDISQDNADKVGFLTMQDVADILGIGRQKTNNKMASLVYKDMFVFSRVKVGNETKFKVNPYVLYRKREVPPEIGAEFHVKASEVKKAKQARKKARATERAKTKEQQTTKK